MKINHLINKMKLAQLKYLIENNASIYKSENRDGHNVKNNNLDINLENKFTQNQNQNHSPISSKLQLENIKSSILSKINITPFNNLEENLQKAVIKTWIDMNLPFKEDYIKKLTQYLNTANINSPNNLESLSQNHNINSKSIINAFAFLIKNKLPLSSELIRGLAQTLDQEQSLTQKFNNLNLENISINNPLSDNQQTDLKNVNNSSQTNISLNNNNESSNNLNNIKNQLILDLSSSTGEITQKLNNYSESIRQIMQLLGNLQDNNSQKVLNHLLGQQLLNLETANQENNLALALEIPVVLKENSESVPLYLQINRDQDSDQNENNKSNIENNYKIKFIIELEYLGTISADINIFNETLNCKFLTSDSRTSALIKDNFSHLQEKLDNIGFKVNSPQIEKVNPEDLSSEKKKKNIDNLHESTSNNSPEEYIHIDFKI